MRQRFLRVSHTVEIWLAARHWVCQECYEFCALGLVHCFRERGGTGLGFRSRRNRHPSNPFYDCSNRLLRGTQVDGTIVCWYTPWRVAMSRHLDKSRSQPASPSPPSRECFPYVKWFDIKSLWKWTKWIWWKFIDHTYGLISLWNIPFLCIWSIAFNTWYM